MASVLFLKRLRIIHKKGVRTVFPTPQSGVGAGGVYNQKSAEEAGGKSCENAEIKNVVQVNNI
jgi:hypothetical protein